MGSSKNIQEVVKGAGLPLVPFRQAGLIAYLCPCFFTGIDNQYEPNLP